MEAIDLLDQRDGRCHQPCPRVHGVPVRQPLIITPRMAGRASIQEVDMSRSDKAVYLFLIAAFLYFTGRAVVSLVWGI